MKNNIVKICLFCFVFLGIFAFQKAEAATLNITGTMWSSTIGWINASSTGTVSYHLTLDDSTRTIRGQAWSSNIGWVTFDDATGCSAVGYPNALVSYNQTTGLLSGWARATAAANDPTGGWDGCINFGTPQGGAKYTYNSTTGVGTFSGAAWGDVNVGWVSLLNLSTSGVVQTFSCQPGPIPNNTQICSSDQIGLTANTQNTFVDSCTDGTKCEWVCNSGYHKEGGLCVPNTVPSSGKCEPRNALGDLITFANVGQLVRWTPIGASTGAWSGSGVTGSCLPDNVCEIRYSTIGDKVVKLDGNVCQVKVNGTDVGKLRIINNPDFHEF